MTRWLLLACALSVGCAAGPAGPVDVRLGDDACAHCRMTIVSTQTAAQIVSPGAEPIFFDDLGCLAAFQSDRPLLEDAVTFVIDHDTSTWIDAREAVITKSAATTPMGSGLIATRRRGSAP